MPPEAVGSGRLVAYGAPAAAFGFYLFFVQFYFLKFATDVLLLPPIVSLLFGAGRIWDAITDPLVGYWSDRTRSAWGRRRPWMLAGIPLLALSFVMLWSPPAGLGTGGLVGWSAAALFLFYLAYTVYQVPHQSLGAELSTQYHLRSKIFGAQRMGFVAGMMLSFIALDRARNTPDPRGDTQLLAVVCAGVATLLLLLAPFALRERADYRGRGAGSPWQALRDVTRNPHARILLVVWCVDGLGGGVLGVLAPYITEYVIQRPDLIAVVPAFFVISGIASIPLWVLLSRRIGKRNVWCIALVGNAVCFGGTFFVGPGELTLLYVLLVGAGASNACGGVIGSSMLADTIDWDELETGQRKEGAYSAAWGFALKLSIGLVIALTGVVLQLAGFEPNVQQGETALLALRGLFAGMPFAASLAALVLLLRFRLGPVEHGRIRAQLEARQSGSANASTASPGVDQP